MYDRTFLNLQITRSDIRPHIKLAVSLVIACGHFNLPQGFVWVNILTLSPLRLLLPVDKIAIHHYGTFTFGISASFHYASMRV